jgi:nucleotide-binding universal stress UspA family protein
VLCRKPLGNACEPEVSENEHSPGEELARARLQEIAGRHLTEVEHKIHTAAASERAFAKAVVRVATEVDADLIVLKTHGRKGLSHLILGSVAEEVVRTAPCPVLTLTPAAQEKAAHLRMQEANT